MAVNDAVNHPAHYTKYSVEVIDITRHLPFDTGNTVKYIIRHNDKGNPRQDIEKAKWYLNDAMNHGAINASIITLTREARTEPFPHEATVNLMRLLVEDARLDNPLDDSLVESLICLSSGDAWQAMLNLLQYLDNLTD